MDGSEALDVVDAIERINGGVGRLLNVVRLSAAMSSIGTYSTFRCPWCTCCPSQ